MKLLITGEAESLRRDVCAQLSAMSIPAVNVDPDISAERLTCILQQEQPTAVLNCTDGKRVPQTSVYPALCQRQGIPLLSLSEPHMEPADYGETGTLTDELEQCRAELLSTQQKFRRQEAYLRHLQTNYDLVVNSTGHKLLERYYNLRAAIRPSALKTAVLHPFARIKKAIHRRHTRDLAREEQFKRLSTCKRMDILAVPHTAFVARLLQGILQDAGLESHIHLTQPESYESIPYLIICPQNFTVFPEVYLAFQMEQTVSSRWLTEDYLNILRNAYAVFDYSLENIAYFRKDPVLASKLYYLPLGICPSGDCEEPEKEYDVLFYGAAGIERRQQYLDAIGANYKIRILTDTFGEELYAEMRKAKLIVNIHFYENALLETTRLYETLSVCDSLIISERSSDPEADRSLEGIVDFVEVGNIDAMLDRIAYWLNHEDLRKQAVAESKTRLERQGNAAKFYLYRFLLAVDRIGFEQFYEEVGDFLRLENDRLCLSLPETPERRASFDQDNHYGFTVFPGLRHHIGWIGCGLSYKFIFRKAMEQGLSRLLICEDDTYFPPDFDSRFAKVQNYLSTHDDWDAFSGIMGNMGQVTVLDCQEEQGETFVYLDQMISMVFNAYQSTVFPILAAWDSSNRSVDTNTIDRHLEAHSLRVLTTAPFLVGHKEDLSSTLWTGDNSIYNAGIASSSERLQYLIDEYQLKNPSV